MQINNIKYGLIILNMGKVVKNLSSPPYLFMLKTFFQNKHFQSKISFKILSLRSIQKRRNEPSCKDKKRLNISLL
jgi:hypothetical protein